MAILPEEKQQIQNFVTKLEKPPFNAPLSTCNNVLTWLNSYCIKKRNIETLLCPTTQKCRQGFRLLIGSIAGLISHFMQKPEQQSNLKHQAITLTSTQSGIFLGEKIGNSIGKFFSSPNIDLTEVIARADDVLEQSFTETNSSSTALSFALKSIQRDLEDLNLQEQALAQALNDDRQFVHVAALGAELAQQEPQRMLYRPLLIGVGAYSSQLRENFAQTAQHLREQQYQTKQSN